MPYEEVFIGSNLKCYKHKYFVGLIENNIKPIDAIGEIFDPQIHEAVSMIVDETLDEGTITQEVSKGYISGKAILKPSKVIVSKK